ncbi:OLC1v1012311C1 [Oldenlandia corymbosa var. corymbosa]|uniref:OLC1v1012311C1 n=1 Tax=Oldenlandia corymbosa var. corymbosa TaxID=529605 RepID=A0AAV1DVS2_OLDCO|nr:OLC1v1012311C1 [Oldenlandia corymbosa var. corymbosa]
MHDRVISASYHRGSPSGHKSKGQSHMGQAGSSVGLDDVFDHASLDLQNVSDNEDVPIEDIDSEGFNDFGAITAQPWVVTRPIVGGPHDGSVIPSFFGHVAHLLTAKSSKPSLEMDTRVTYFKLLNEWKKGSMSTEYQILLAGTRLSHIVDIVHTNIDKALITAFVERLIIAQPGTVNCKTLVMRALKMTSQTLQTSKVIHGGGVQLGLVVKAGRVAASGLDETPGQPRAGWYGIPIPDNSAERLRKLRLQIDKLTPTNVEWLPDGPEPVYDDPRTIYIDWIQYRDIIDPYLPNGVLRQIGYIQVIPPPISYPISAIRSGNHHSYKVSWRATEALDAWLQFSFSSGWI